ncbi:MAG: phenylacetic acid degradation bifunctional protein PaaZ [Bacteroidota bacterium]|jgi:oxepin-CoA hydrolase/3-oxo-5,6-dehydrosuberyl-CoA semialdehyde dehydrogenase
MRTLEHYILGQWQSGQGEKQVLSDAATGEGLFEISKEDVDFAAVFHYGRTVGGPALRKLTFHERGRMLKALAMFLNERKAAYYEWSYKTGATKVDSWIDIDGGIGNLFAYASLRRQFPNERFYTDGEMAKLSKNGTFGGHHIMVPKQGVAFHINAFNFPIWGMLEKIAVNLLAGVPAVVKPASISGYLTELVVKDIIASQILPEGALQLIMGSAYSAMDHVTMQDVVTFTGSASTGKKLKSHPNIVQESVPFNLEADSLNAAVLGLQAAPGTPEFDLFIKEVRKEMTVKCGQKCTAVRRIVVPENYVGDVQAALAKALSQTVIGLPTHEKVRMGALASMSQKSDVLEKIGILQAQSELVYQGDLSQLIDANGENGAFIAPTLFLNSKPFENLSSHEVEAFGPVATILPYKTTDEAVAITKLGKGSLVSSITTFDDQEAKEYAIEAAAYHGRILVLNRESAVESTGHGSPMPMLVHGGPGRAGGGEEMGGKRGVMHYLQRTAIQGTPTTLSAITGVYQYGGAQREAVPHLFRQHFEDLVVGDTVFTHKHTVSDADIVNFANVSGDNFYAHMDATSLEGTIFERRVAHGYFVLSKAAGLFVDPKKGPVLLNYGLEDCRFTKPVYPGMTIGVKFTVKEKIDQEKRNDEDIPKGIVKFLVDVYDETGETVALATILTMVKKREE